jgi:hypothetical protein
MKPLTVMDGPFELGVGRDKEGDGRLLHLAARVFVTAVQCALLTVAMTSVSAGVTLQAVVTSVQMKPRVIGTNSSQNKTNSAVRK